MKYKIILLVILFPVLSQAQTASTIDSLIENLKIDLKDSWTLGIDSNGTNLDIRTYNKFKNLFDTSATVVDNINIFYQRNPGDKSGFYKIDNTPKSFDVYAHDVALQVSKLRITADTIIKVVNDPLNPGYYSMAIKRVIYREKTRRFVLPDIDSLVTLIIKSHLKEMNFAYRSDYSKMVDSLKKKINENPDAIYKFESTDSVLIKFFYSKNDLAMKIKSIEILWPMKIYNTNDRDNDGLVFSEDQDEDHFGEFTAKGRPDADLDGVPDGKSDSDDQCPDTYGTKNNRGCPDYYFSSHKQIDGFIGFQLNSTKIHLPELNNLGYKDNSGNDEVDVLQSQKGNLKTNRWVPGTHAGANFTYFFGKKRKSGVSIGLSFSWMSADYLLVSPIVYTYKSFDGNDYYRRQITISKLDEQINTGIYNIPVMYNYRTYVNSKRELVFSFKIGPSLMFFNGRSNYNANVDVGGIYQVDTIGKDKISFYDHFDPGSTYNVYVNSEGINNQNTNPGAIAVFSQLPKNSDFVSNKNFVGRKNLVRTTVGINAAFQGQFPITTANSKGSFLSIKFGGHFVYAPLFERTEKYKPIERTTDEYNSIFNSNAASKYIVYGVTAGFVYNL